MKAKNLGMVIAIFATSLVLPTTIQSTAAQQYVPANACVRYAYMPRTVMKQQKVTAYKWVEETEFATEKITSFKPVTRTEKRERKVVTRRPVTRTRFREEKYYEYERVVETSFDEVVEEKTVYDVVTEMRDQERVVEKPVIERTFREERYLVRKPVTETQMQTENVIVYKPVTQTHTAYRQTVTPVQQWAYQPGNVRNRLQYLRPGYYPDANGQLAYKTGGLYWVPQQNPGRYQVQTANVVNVTPQQYQQTTMVPETITRQKPVDVTRFVDTYETRKIPVETRTVKRETIIEQVPVEVRKPRIVRTTRKVPRETVKMVPKEIVRKVPYKETVFETVETIEPYEVKVTEWVTETSEKTVPKKVYKRVPVESTQVVPVREMYRVPLDAWGNPIYSAATPDVIEVVETRKPLTTGQTYYGNLRVVDDPLQVVEGTTQGNPRNITVRNRVPFVEDGDLIPVEGKKEDDGAAKSVLEKQESRKPAVGDDEADKAKDNGSGNDRVDLKRPNNQGGDQAGNQNENADGNENGKLNGPQNDG